MRYDYNNPILKPRRQELRGNSTKAEKILWRCLKGGQLGSFKFVRQYSVGPYILDFFCPKARLAIELDGSQHTAPEQRVYDDERTSYLKERDIGVIRFWNDDVMNCLEEVLLRISQSLPPS